MKIAWVTPLARMSAIGRIGVHVCEELASRGHDVTIVRCEWDNELKAEPHGTSLPVTDWRSREAIDVVRSHDAVFVNVGDNYLFHAGIFPYLETGATTGIFHDFYLYNLFRGWLQDHHESSGEIHDREIVLTYGNDARLAAEKARGGTFSLPEIASTIPMTEWVASKCSGAVAHSSFYVPRLANSCFGPVTVAALPWQGRDVSAPRPGKTRPLTVLTVGVANPNKCSEEIVRAIGSSGKLRENVSYVVAGAIGDEFGGRIRQLADQQRVNLTVTGQVDDTSLHKILESADIICCLRKPVLEGASASAIEGMLTARPILVADAGFYADLPDECVFKVSEDVSPEEVRACLEALVDDEQLRLESGLKARTWAENTFTPEAYASRLEQSVDRGLRFLPFRQLGHRVARELSELGVDHSDPLVGRIGRVADGMMPRSLAATEAAG